MFYELNEISRATCKAQPLTWISDYGKMNTLCFVNQSRDLCLVTHCIYVYNDHANWYQGIE